MWYAIRNSDKRVIAAAPGFCHCSDMAAARVPISPGQVAPYFLTTSPVFFRAVFPLIHIKE